MNYYSSFINHFTCKPTSFKGTSVYYLKKIYNKCKLALILIIFLSNILHSIFLNYFVLSSLAFNLASLGASLLLFQKNQCTILSIVLLASLGEISIAIEFAPLIILFSTNSKVKSITLAIFIYLYRFLGPLMLKQEQTSLNKQSIFIEYERLIIYLGFSLFLHHILGLNSMKIYQQKKKKVESIFKLHEAEIKIKELEKSRDNFILKVSHELRNPLNIMIGNLELALRKLRNFTIEIQEIIKNAKIYGEILLNLINNFLDIVKLQSGNIDINSNPTNIRQLIEKIWSSISDPIRKKGLSGEIYFFQEIPVLMSIDAHRVMQIIFNIVNNALEYTTQGSIKIVISWVYHEDLRPSKLFDDMQDDNMTRAKTKDHFPLNVSRSSSIMEDIKLDKALASRLNSKSPQDDNPSCEIGDSKEFNRDSSSKWLVDHEFALKNLQSYYKMDLNQRKFHTGSSKLYKKEFDDITNNEGYIKIEIIDTGCGMSQETLDKLFITKYIENRTRCVGIGIGSWLTRIIVQSMKGNIAAYSAKDHGSTIVILLKATIMEMTLTPSPILTNNLISNSNGSDVLKSSQIKTTPENKISAEMNSIRSEHRKLKAMVVDDSVYNQQIHHRFLEVNNVEVVYLASNGYEALEAYKQIDNLDFIMMDIDMPIMDGKDACKQIRKYEIENKIPQIEIIIVTGYATEIQKNECLNPEGDIKANLFYSKPISCGDCENFLKVLFPKLRCTNSNINPVNLDNSSVIMKSNKKSNQIFSIRKNLESIILEEAFKSSKIDAKPNNLKDTDNRRKCLLFIQEYDFSPKLLIDFQSAGFKVLKANSLDTSINIIKNNIDELVSILIDCDGIEIDGYECAIKIYSYLKAVTEDWNIPIYGITFREKFYMITKGKQYGMNDLIFKPINLKKIEDLLKNFENL